MCSDGMLCPYLSGCRRNLVDRRNVVFVFVHVVVVVAVIYAAVVVVYGHCRHQSQFPKCLGSS